MAGRERIEVGRSGQERIGLDRQEWIGAESLGVERHVLEGSGTAGVDRHR